MILEILLAVIIIGLPLWLWKIEEEIKKLNAKIDKLLQEKLGK